MTNLILLALLGCGGGPAVPVPTTTDPAAGPDGVPGEASPDTDAPTSELPTLIPAGSAALPEALVCPADNPGSFGCFREVPGGTLRLGAQATDPSAPGHDPAARPDEGPVTEVPVATFWIQATEVIASHVAVCIREGGCSADDVLSDGNGTVGVRGKGALPATGVSWKAADAFCRWVGARLPTEAEYEWVTRGAEGRRYTWGDQITCNRVTVHPPSPAGEADEVCRPVIEVLSKRLGEAAFTDLGAAIGRLPQADVAAACKAMTGLAPEAIEAKALALAASAPPEAPPPPPTPCPSDAPVHAGALDDHHPLRVIALTGNLREWVADDYAPRGGPPLDGPRKLTKGGSYLSEDDDLRAAARDPLPAEARLPDVGFRCAWTKP